MLLLWLSMIVGAASLMNFADPRFRRPVELEGVPGYLAIVTVCDADGELAARWYAQPHGVGGWTSGPEVLVFLAHTAYGWTHVAGNPLTQSIEWIAARPPYGWYDRPTDNPWTFMQRELRPPHRRWLVMLPAPLAQGRAQDEAEEAAGGPRRCAGRTVDGARGWQAEEGGMEYRVSVSPSGRWVAVVERQRRNTFVIFEISVDGSDEVRVVGTVDLDDRPFRWAEPSKQSPDGQWTATLGREGVTIESVDGQARVLPIEGRGEPIWAPDSRRFAFQSSAGTMVADVEGDARLLLVSGPLLVTGWTEHGLAWLVGTFGSDE